MENRLMTQVNQTTVALVGRWWSNKGCGVLTLAIFVFAFSQSPTPAQVKHPAQASVVQQEQSAQQPAKPALSPAHSYFTDVVLVNQDGEKMRLYSDLLHDKVVVINSFFATCPGSCLPMERNLEKVQQTLGDRMGKEVHIISISVDPTVDTPANLKAYAKKMNAKPGWYFMTGEKQNVDFALGKLGQLVTNKEEHLNIFIIGNERTGLWKKAFGLAQSAELVKVVESVLNDKPAGDK
jgi:protein SCO1/2